MSKFYDEDNQDDVISKADAAELMGAVTDLEARVQDLTKRFEQAEREPKQIVVNKSASGPNDFNIKVSEIRKRDGCSRTEAMQKARREAPESFAAFNGTD